MTDQPSHSPSSTGVAIAEARHAAATVTGDAGRIVRYGLPWFGVLFMMALPLPFLGIFDGAQEYSPSGLDFSAFAATLALILHGAIWLRSELEQNYPGGIPFPLGMREAQIVIGGLFLISIPVWCWLQVGGLLFSMEHRFFATHKLAGWFGHRTILDIGISESLRLASIAYAALALLTTALALRFSLVMVDLTLDKPIQINAVWEALDRHEAWQLALALIFGAAPFLLVAGIAQSLIVCCGLPGPVIGVLQVVGTLALFPASACVGITLGRMSRHLGYNG